MAVCRAGPIRILAIHLLPATRGFLTAQATLLLPAFILAEATLSYVGLGFAPPAASWGAMLSEASNISAIADFPWLLSPAAAIIAVVLAVNLASGAGARGGAFGALARSRRETSRGRVGPVPRWPWAPRADSDYARSCALRQYNLRVPRQSGRFTTARDGASGSRRHAGAG